MDKFKSGGDFSQRERTGTPLPAHSAELNERDELQKEAFEEAAEYYRKNSEGSGSLDKSKSAELWIKVRDCLTSDAQKEFRYDERQMKYHYDIDRNLEYLVVQKEEEPAS